QSADKGLAPAHAFPARTPLSRPVGKFVDKFGPEQSVSRRPRGAVGGPFFQGRIGLSDGSTSLFSSGVILLVRQKHDILILDESINRLGTHDCSPAHFHWSLLRAFRWL